MIASYRTNAIYKRAAMFALAASFLFFSIEAKPAYQLYKTHKAEPTNQKQPKAESSFYGDLQHEIENHEHEIRFLQERLNTQESILDSLREELREKSTSNQELFKGNAALTEKRVETIERGQALLSEDLRDLQTHSNETAKTMGQYKQKLLEMETQFTMIHNAMDTLFAALQIESVAEKGQAKIYEVRPGDKLEKIARNFNTSVIKIKQLNELSNDRIYVGQKLKIP